MLAGYFDGPTGNPVTVLRLSAPVHRPEVPILSRKAIQHHRLVVSPEEGAWNLLGERQKAVDDPSGIRSAVHIISHENEVILRGRGQFFNQRLEGAGAPMYIPYGY